MRLFQFNRTEILSVYQRNEYFRSLTSKLDYLGVNNPQLSA